MKLLTAILFMLIATCASAQKVTYDLVTLMSIKDTSTISTDSIFYEKGTFLFSNDEIIQEVDSVKTIYPIFSRYMENNRMYFNITNKAHDFILISSDNFIGGSINMGFLKSEKTVIYSYIIKCVE